MKNLVLLICTTILTAAAYSQDGEFHLDKSYKISMTGLLDLSSSDANVFITGSKRNDAHIKIDRKVTTKGWSSDERNFTVDVIESDGNIRIRERQSGTNVSFGYYREDYKIEIEIPEGVSLSIRGDDGDYFIKNVNGSVEMSIDDADAELIDCKGSKFDFRLDDGDIRMDKGKGLLVIDGDDADVHIRNGSFDKIEADIDDGDLVIETALKSNSNYNIKGQDALIDLTVIGGGGEFSVNHDDGSVSFSGDFKTITETEDKTIARLNSGNAKVNVWADDGRVKLSSRE
jgi:hypothetical protein